MDVDELYDGVKQVLDETVMGRYTPVESFGVVKSLVKSYKVSRGEGCDTCSISNGCLGIAAIAITHDLVMEKEDRAAALAMLN